MKNLLPLRILTLLLLAVILGGCSTGPFTNLTPRRQVENPSHIYPFSFTARLTNANIIRDSIRAHIAVNGEVHPMKPDPLGGTTFTFEYQLPSEQREIKYYYILEYSHNTGNFIKHERVYSASTADTVHRMRIINRYPIQLVANRGPVGAGISLVGRGFSSFDRIVFGEVELPTHFESTTSLRFNVPPVPAGVNYPVRVRTGQGDLEAGLFRVDAATLSVMPDSLSLTPGTPQILLFRISQEAPPGGLLVDVTTDIAHAVIMPEVVIPGGAQTVSVTVEGSQPGTGSLFIEAPGFTRVVVPVTVY